MRECDFLRLKHGFDAVRTKMESNCSQLIQNVNAILPTCTWDCPTKEILASMGYCGHCGTHTSLSDPIYFDPVPKMYPTHCQQLDDPGYSHHSLTRGSSQYVKDPRGCSREVNAMFKRDPLLVYSTWAISSHNQSTFSKKPGSWKNSAKIEKKFPAVFYRKEEKPEV